jgi:hypothetical protein
MHSPSTAPVQASKPVNGSVFPLGSFRLDFALEPVLVVDATGVAVGVVALVVGVTGTVDGELEVVGVVLGGGVVALPVWVWPPLWW